jgi:uncharacterized protein (DUF924 family)
VVETVASPASILVFWREAGPERWFKAAPAIDALVRECFLTTYEAAAAGRLANWEASAEDALALVIVLDQFPRNMFRGTARAFATDAQAREVARRAIERGFDRKIAMHERTFFYLPFEHSEELTDQEQSLALYESTGDAESVKWAQIHLDVIRRFGRFPHRNQVLGRGSSPEEIAFLEGGGFRA